MNKFILNIADNGMHFGRMELNADTITQATAMANIVRLAFGQAGLRSYRFTLTRWEEVGHPVEEFNT